MLIHMLSNDVPLHTPVQTFIGAVFTFFVVALVIGFLILRGIGRAAKKAAPYVAVPLVLIGVLVLFPKLAPWFKKRWGAAVDAVRPEAKLVPETQPEPSADVVKGEPLYRAEIDPENGEVHFVQVA